MKKIIAKVVGVNPDQYGQAKKAVRLDDVGGLRSSIAIDVVEWDYIPSIIRYRLKYIFRLVGNYGKKGTTNSFYDAEFAEAWANLRSLLGKDWRRFVLAYLLVVSFLAGAVIEHYFPEWLTFLW